MVDRNLHHLLLLLKILNMKNLIGFWFLWANSAYDGGEWLSFDFRLEWCSCDEGQTRYRPVVLKPNLKEFLSACVKNFTMYICSSAMKRNFLRHLDIIAEKISVLLLFSKILDQTFSFKNCHFLLEKLNKPIFHKNLKDFFHLFPSTTFENTLLIDDMPHKSMLNPPCSAIFF